MRDLHVCHEKLSNVTFSKLAFNGYFLQMPLGEGLGTIAPIIGWHCLPNNSPDTFKIEFLVISKLSSTHSRMPEFTNRYMTYINPYLVMFEKQGILKFANINQHPHLLWVLELISKTLIAYFLDDLAVITGSNNQYHLCSLNIAVFPIHQYLMCKSAALFSIGRLLCQKIYGCICSIS